MQLSKYRRAVRRSFVLLIAMAGGGCSTQLETWYLEHQVAELREELQSENQRLTEIQVKSGSEGEPSTTKPSRLKGKKRKKPHYKKNIRPNSGT